MLCFRGEERRRNKIKTQPATKENVSSRPKDGPEHRCQPRLKSLCEFLELSVLQIPPVFVQRHLFQSAVMNCFTFLELLLPLLVH